MRKLIDIITEDSAMEDVLTVPSQDTEVRKPDAWGDKSPPAVTAESIALDDFKAAIDSYISSCNASTSQKCKMNLRMMKKIKEITAWM